MNLTPSTSRELARRSQLSDKLIARSCFAGSSRSWQSIRMFVSVIALLVAVAAVIEVFPFLVRFAATEMVTAVHSFQYPASHYIPFGLGIPSLLQVAFGQKHDEHA